MEWADLSDGELCARLGQRDVMHPSALVRERDDPRVADFITIMLEGES